MVSAMSMSEKPSSRSTAALKVSEDSKSSRI
jgi:hypothetical protein